MTATYKDIQRLTGLSLSTISKYFNGSSIREGNATAIRNAVEQLDYRVNSIAQSLRTQRSKTIGILLPDLTNTFHARIISEISAELMASGYGVIVASYDEVGGSIDAAVEFLLSKMVDGVAMVPDSSGVLPEALRSREEELPVVVLDRVPSDEIDSVTVDNVRAGAEVGRLLLSRGHRSVGVLAGPQVLSSTSGRTRGLVRAFTEAGVPVAEDAIVHTPLTVEDARLATRMLMLSPEPPTSIFATNAELTTGAVIALRELGLSMPTDVSFVGFDNEELALAVPPGLDVIVQPIVKIAQVAAEVLLERLEGQGLDGAVHRVLRCSLHEGASVSLPGRSGAAGSHEQS